MGKDNQSKSVFTISGRHRFVACVIVVILVSCGKRPKLNLVIRQS